MSKKSKASRVLTGEHKDKISIGMKKYFEQHPEKVPCRLNHYLAQKIIEEYQLSNIRALARKHNLSRYVIKAILSQACIKLKTDKEVRQQQGAKVKTNNNKDLFESDVAKKIIEEYQLPFHNTRTLRNKYKVSRKKITKILKNANVRLKHHNETQRARRIQKLFESEKGKKIIEEYQLLGNGLVYLQKKYRIKTGSIKKILRLANVKIKTFNDVWCEQISLGRHIGKNNHMYGKVPPIGAGRCKWYCYNDVAYQGKYEFRFGLWLIHQNIKFYCHEHVRQFHYQLNGVDRVYNPDFYLIDDDVFVEIKGYFTEEARRKMDIVKEMYPNEKIEIYNKDKLKELGVLDIDKKLNIKLCAYES